MDSAEAENAPLNSQEEEKSMNNILAARREARRRRILENSNKRLSRITGREHNEPPLDSFVTSPDIIYPDPEMERDTLRPEEFLRQGGIASQEQDVLEMLREFRAQAGMSSSSMNSQQSPKEPQTMFTRILKQKIHYMVMGVIVSLLFATENEWIVGKSVFLPLFCWEAIEVFLLKTYETKLNFLGIIFVFLGMKQRTVEIVTKIIETLNKLLKDFACFMWFFIMTHLIWGYFVEQKGWSEVLFPKGHDEGAICPNV